MRIICFVLVLLSSFVNMQAQESKDEYFIPIELHYFPGYKYRIPFEDKFDNDTWVRMLNYPYTHLKTVNELKARNIVLYDYLSQKVLFSRKSCDSLVRDYITRMQKIDNRSFYGKEGGYKTNPINKDDLYLRCVCIPAIELVGIRHDQKIKMGHVFKYFDPEPFCSKFKRYKLDSLDLAEAPYYTIFPLDIDPSFACKMARTPIEKAICRSRELAKYDKELSVIFNLAIKKKGEIVKTNQKEWLQKRDELCRDKNNEEITKILIELYDRRIKELL